MSGSIGFSSPIARGLFNAASWVENVSRRLKGKPPVSWSLYASGGRVRGHDFAAKRHPFPRIGEADARLGFKPGGVVNREEAVERMKDEVHVRLVRHLDDRPPA